MVLNKQQIQALLNKCDFIDNDSLQQELEAARDHLESGAAALLEVTSAINYRAIIPLADRAIAAGEITDPDIGELIRLKYQ